MSRHRPEGSIPPGTSIGRYLVEHLLGSGGMGEVYAARDQQLGRRVALKILAPDRASDPSRVQRFLREAQLASSLNHPAIVTVYDSGTVPFAGEIVHFLAMELVDGETLSVWTRSTRDRRKIVELLASVADGLARAHASGIVHRDLKPQNIMVARGGHPKILDFGVAKLTEARPENGDSIETAPAHAIGTGAYMSPEQVEGIDVDHRADIFSFGAVLYEALTGRAPFTRGSIVESMHAVLHDEPPHPGLPPALTRIIRKCLVKDREARYQSIKDVAIDLRETNREPDVASSARRRLPAIGAALGAIIAVIAGLAILRDRRDDHVALAAPAVAPQPVMLRMTNSGNIAAGAVSPDGNYIVYSTLDGENQTVWVKQVATGTNVRIIAPQPMYYVDFRVSSDGNYVFYAAAKLSEPNITDVYRMPILGGESRIVARDVEMAFAVSPDATKVAFLRFNAFERLYRLTMADIESGRETVLIARPYPGIIGPMAWAPDGRTMTFIGAIVENDKPLRPGLFNIDTATRRISPVPSPQWWGIRSLTWLPDGSGLLVTVADSQQPKQIYLLPKDSTAARKITSDISAYGWLTVTADSRSIVAHRADVTANLWLIDTQDPAKTRALTTGLGNCFGTAGVRWLPDGKVLYTTCGGSPSLSTLDIASGETRQLTRGSEIWGPTVSPNGKRIAAISDRSGKNEIWVADTATADFKQLTHVGPVSSPSWSPDNESIYFNTSGTEQSVWRVNLNGKTERLITRPTNAPMVSPDGKLLLCRMRSSDPKTSLWQTALVRLDSVSNPRILPIPLHGGPPRPQWRDLHTFGYLEHADGVGNLWLHDLRGVAPKQLTRFDSGEICAYDFSPDGRYIAISHGERVNDIVMIRDFR